MIVAVNVDGYHERWRGNRGNVARSLHSLSLVIALFSMSAIVPTRELLLAPAKNIVDTE